MERSADWIAQARRDFEHAQNDVASGFFEWACFSAQQAAEKAIKAVFQKMGADAWGHSVADLITELGKLHPTPQAIGESALALDKAYIPSRYPDAHPSGSPYSRYTRTEAERMVTDAEEVLRFCEGLLSTLPPR